jgi:hypothetical protein
MGYKAIIIYGDPEYYKRFGFNESKQYGITKKDKKYPVALLVLELFPNALNGIEGIFEEGKVYEVDKNELLRILDSLIINTERGDNLLIISKDEFNNIK